MRRSEKKYFLSECFILEVIFQQFSNSGVLVVASGQKMQGTGSSGSFGEGGQQENDNNNMMMIVNPDDFPGVGAEKISTQGTQ